MKRILMILVAVLAFTCIGYAQGAVGVRVGCLSGISAEASFQSEFSYHHRLELDAGISNITKSPVWFNLTVAYHYRSYLLSRTNWFAGPALAARVSTDPHAGLAAGLQAGLEYELYILPLTISLDFRPMVNVLGPYAYHPYFDLGLSLRYLI